MFNKLYILAVSIALISLLVGCGFPDALAEAQEASVIFNAQAVETEGRDAGKEAVKTINISGKELSQSSNWNYLHCLDQNDKVTEMVVNGDVIYNDWVTFTIIYDRTAIAIRTKPNKEGKMRKLTFVGAGKQRTFKIHIYQD